MYHKTSILTANFIFHPVVKADIKEINKTNNTIMAKDLTRYKMSDQTDFIPKNRFVLSILTKFFKTYKIVEHPKRFWPDEIQGNIGLIKRIDEIDKERYFFMENQLKGEDGNSYVVCNQWGRDNFEIFLPHAKKFLDEINLQIESNKEQDVFQVEKNENKTTEESEKISLIIGEGLEAAIAFLIRQVIVADGLILEEELNWMQRAFNDFDDLEINVRDAWENVDTMAQYFTTINYTDAIFINSVMYVDQEASHDVKSTLLNILQQIAAQDDVVDEAEYNCLKFICNTFFPGQLETMRNSFLNSNIKLPE